MLSNNNIIGFTSLSEQDKELLRALTVPVGHDEEKRLRILRESAILDTAINEPNFDRFSSLCIRLFNVSPYCLIEKIFKNKI